MATHRVLVKNIHCDASMNLLKTGLLKAPGVTELEIKKDENSLDITGPALRQTEIIEILNKLDYHQHPGSGYFVRKNSFDFWHCSFCNSCD